MALPTLRENMGPGTHNVSFNMYHSELANQDEIMGTVIRVNDASRRFLACESQIWFNGTKISDQTAERNAIFQRIQEVAQQGRNYSLNVTEAPPMVQLRI